MKQVFFIHIMKTAGTSFRLLLEEAVGEGLYPTSAELNAQSRRWYLETRELQEAARTGTLNLRERRVIIGHYPYALGAEICSDPFYATFLRHPVARSVSMLGHAARHHSWRNRRSITDLLADRELVEGQIENYQTKVFAMEASDGASVNEPLRIDRELFDLAATRLMSMDFVGLTEHFEGSVELFERKAGIDLPVTRRRDNVGWRLELTAEEYQTIDELIPYDRELYRLALERFNSETRAE